MSWDQAPVQIRLDPQIGDERSLVARLSDSGGRVAARLDGGIVVVRPVGPTLVAGMPAYYSSRPEFRGKMLLADDGGLVLRGFVQDSGMPLLFNAIGAFFAIFVGLTGAALLASGEPLGLVAFAFAAVVGAAIVATTVMVRRLSAADQRTIMSEVRAIELPGPTPTP